MANTLSIPGFSAENQIGFETWMERVIELADGVRKDWGPAAVHDLRVALRRCRTMSDALNEIAPGAGWRRVKKESRELFDALGELRDAQVERAWVKRLVPSGDAVRKHMLRLLSRQERKRGAEAARALDRFDAKIWRKLGRKLQSKSEEFPLESIVFQRLALERLDEAVVLCQRARKGRSRVAWHRLRIGLKRFRYIVENFLPQRYGTWAPDLKRTQELLGEVHDLDVLRAEIRRRCDGFEEEAVAAWLQKIEKERAVRLDEFRAIGSQPNAAWQAWRAGLPTGYAAKASPTPERAMAASAG
ncbi:MAG TPA: CHAD domain-containing protein [Methylomirabilota bacterium]|nr:CHAD domain-containing protein [Methylomirabilota bacterium]